MSLTPLAQIVRLGGIAPTTQSDWTAVCVFLEAGSKLYVHQPEIASIMIVTAWSQRRRNILPISHLLPR
jgi:hypothetical protein